MSGSAITYRPEIDGLRAIAVIPVILFHLDLPWARGGFLGVDVFFVISGFLITSIILSEHHTGQFTFRRFWTRRFRRILPALAVMVVLVTCCTWIALPRPARRDVGLQGASAMLATANIYFWRVTSNYWGTAAAEAPFLHTWSLAVEEQFYLLYPAALMTVLRYRPKWLVPLLTSACVLGYGTFLYGTTHFPSATFYLLPTRAWELLAGCWLAALAPEDSSSRLPPAARSLLSLIGLGIIGFSYACLTRLEASTLATVAGTILVLRYGNHTPCRYLLANRLVATIGRLSYSLYLWHWPVIVLTRGNQWQLSPIAVIGVVAACASASYLFVEQPARTRRAGSAGIVCAYAAALVGSFSLLASPAAYESSRFHTPTSYVRYYDVSPHPSFATTPADDVAFGGCISPQRQGERNAWMNGGFTFGGKDVNPRVVVLGDSHGCMWSHTIRSITEDRGLPASLWCAEGVSPGIQIPPSASQRCHGFTPAEKLEFDLARLRFIEKWRPTVVVIAARWDGVTEGAMDDLLGFLEKHAGAVLLVEQPPVLATGDQNVLQWLCFKGVRPRADHEFRVPSNCTRNYDEGRHRIRDYSRRYSNVSVVPLYELYANEDKVLVLEGKDVLYYDDDHLTGYGTDRAKTALSDAIDKALAHAAATGDE